MLNNPINKAMDAYYPHDFSIHDIDGITWWINFNDTKSKPRLILFEHKHKNEGFTGTQLDGFRLLAKAIDWTMFAPHSGYFIFHEIDDNNYKVYDLDEHYLCDTTMDQLYEWFSGKDVSKKFWTKKPAHQIERDEFINSHKSTAVDYEPMFDKAAKERQGNRNDLNITEFIPECTND